VIRLSARATDPAGDGMSSARPSRSRCSAARRDLIQRRMFSPEVSIAHAHHSRSANARTGSASSTRSARNAVSSSIQGRGGLTERATTTKEGYPAGSRVKRTAPGTRCCRCRSAARSCSHWGEAFHAICRGHGSTKTNPQGSTATLIAPLALSAASANPRATSRSGTRCVMSAVSRSRSRARSASAVSKSGRGPRRQ